MTPWRRLHYCRPGRRPASRSAGGVRVIPDVTRTARRRILVYDDVCATASQLDVVAECLLDEGHAARVEGLVLARAPWRRRT